MTELFSSQAVENIKKNKMVNKFLTVRTEVLRNCSEGSHSIDDFAPCHVSEKLKLSFFVKGEQFFLNVGENWQNRQILLIQIPRDHIFLY